MVAAFSNITGGLADGVAFSPGGALGDNMYVADFNYGRIMVVNPAGTASVFATGFNFVDAIDTKIAIAADGSALYISERDSIVLISAIPEASGLLMLGAVAACLAGLQFSRRVRAQ